MITREEVREHLTGPFASLSIVFNRDGSIDYDGLRSLIDAGISGGGKTVLLTYGDSLFSLLTDEEIADVTRAVVEHTADRAMVVAADGGWATGKTVEFAGFARKAGADVLMVKPPIWAGSCTVNTFVEHFATVAEQMPVMLVTNVFDGRHETGFQTIERLRDEVENVVAIKDDQGGPFAAKMTAMVGDKWAVFSGGTKQRHLEIVHHGAVGYMSNFVTFRPSVTSEYWSAVQRGDWESAGKVVSDHDRPLMDYIGKLPGGFDAGIHGILELCGIAGRWRRKPYYSLNDAEMEQLQDFVKGRGWL